LIENRFDIASVNNAAYRQWIRSYRYLLSSLLIVLVGFECFFALILARLTAGLHSVSATDVPYVISAMVVVGGLCGLLAYAVSWMYRPGARSILVTAEGLTVAFNRGRPFELRWTNPRFRLRISRTAAPGNAEVGASGETQIAIQSARHPHIELTGPALSCILDAARARNLEVNELSVSLSQARSWDRIFVRSPPR
jgi:hypothetical protein